MDRYYLGIDTGATKSHALLCDQHGGILGFAEGGPGNWENVGWQGLQNTLEEIIGAVLYQAQISRGQITAAAYGLAGFDWPEDHAPHAQLVARMGLQGPQVIVNDAFLGIPAGTSSGWGVTISAGTSCNGYGRDRHGRIGRVTGHGRFGEWAGAGELVESAVQAVARAWSRRGPITALSEAFIAATGATDEMDLLAGLVRGRYFLQAGHAILVFDVARTGDRVAQELIRWAGEGLGDLAVGIIRQLDMATQEVEVVLAGSFFQGSPELQKSMGRVIHEAAPYAGLVRLHTPPVVGAALLAMTQENLPVPDIRRPLTANLQRWLGESR